MSLVSHVLCVYSCPRTFFVPCRVMERHLLLIFLSFALPLFSETRFLHGLVYVARFSLQSLCVYVVSHSCGNACHSHPSLLSRSLVFSFPRQGPQETATTSDPEPAATADVGKAGGGDEPAQATEPAAAASVSPPSSPLASETDSAQLSGSRKLSQDTSDRLRQVRTGTKGELRGAIENDKNTESTCMHTDCQCIIGIVRFFTRRCRDLVAVLFFSPSLLLSGVLHVDIGVAPLIIPFNC